VAQHIENLHEVKRKPKIENEINKTESTIMTLTQEIILGKENLTERQDLYDKNKGVIKQLDEIQSKVRYLEGEISKKKQILAAATSELNGIRSNYLLRGISGTKISSNPDLRIAVCFGHMVAKSSQNIYLIPPDPYQVSPPFRILLSSVCRTKVTDQLDSKYLYQLD
jgi:hypothetical protein